VSFFAHGGRSQPLDAIAQGVDPCHKRRDLRGKIARFA
jgi:hypothetical protein